MSVDLTVANLPSNALAFTNFVYINDSDFNTLRAASPLSDAEHDKEVQVSGLAVQVLSWVFNVKPLKAMNPGEIGMNGLQRRTASLSLNQRLSVAPYQLPEDGFALASLHLEVDLVRKARNVEAESIDCPGLGKIVAQNFNNHTFAVGQMFAADFAGVPLSFKVTSVAPSYMKGAPTGRTAEVTRGMLLAKNTEIVFAKQKEANIKMVGQGSSTGSKIFQPNFDFGKLGIGGLDEEFSEIFRRAFASRTYSSAMIKQMGMHHVRGMLLYGPPGCGKTLIARKIGACLNAREPKVGGRESPRLSNTH
jgi:vesicle-fusing ATPase